MDINIKTIVPLLILVLIMFDCIREDQIINPNLAVVLATIITIYIVAIGIITLIRKSQHIKDCGFQYWEYKRFQYESGFLMPISVLLVSTIFDGTIKYIFIIMGIILLIGLILKIYLAKKYKFQLVAINSNEIINIKESYFSYNINKFKLKSRSSDKIEIGSRWKSFKIIENDFNNSDEMLNRITDKIRFF